MTITDQVPENRCTYVARGPLRVHSVVCGLVLSLNDKHSLARISSGKGLSISRRTVLLAAVLFIYICSTTHWAIALAVFHRFIGHPAEASGYTVTEMAVSVVATGIDVRLLHIEHCFELTPTRSDHP